MKNKKKASESQRQRGIKKLLRLAKAIETLAWSLRCSEAAREAESLYDWLKWHFR